MGPVYRLGAGTLPGAEGKIVFDKFHIAKHLGEAVDQVRRSENKTLRAAGDDRLAGTRYDWLRNPAAMEPKDRREFAELRNSDLKTARAWALKEAAMALFSYVYERPARKHFRWWHGWAVRSRLQPMIEMARMLKRRLENILTYLRHRITNAASESINSKIQWVKYTARGFRRPSASDKTSMFIVCEHTLGQETNCVSDRRAQGAVTRLIMSQVQSGARMQRIWRIGRIQRNAG